MIRRIFILAFLLLVFAPGAEGAETQKPLPLDRLPDFTVSRGDILYQRYCLFCHGESGAGDGPAGLSMTTPPADLRVVTRQRSREQLRGIILQGGGSSGPAQAMPGFAKTLTEKQLEDLLDCILSF